MLITCENKNLSKCSVGGDVESMLVLVRCSVYDIIDGVIIKTTIHDTDQPVEKDNGVLRRQTFSLIYNKTNNLIRYNGTCNYNDTTSKHFNELRQSSRNLITIIKYFITLRVL